MSDYEVCELRGGECCDDGCCVDAFDGVCYGVGGVFDSGESVEECGVEVAEEEEVAAEVDFAYAVCVDVDLREEFSDSFNACGALEGVGVWFAVDPGR